MATLNPISQLANHSLPELLNILGIKKNSPLIGQIQTFLNDDPTGNNTKLDPREAYSFAQFLFQTRPQDLRISITADNLRNYQKQFGLSPIPQRESLTNLDVTSRGIKLRNEAAEKMTTFFKPHFDANKKGILQAADLMTQTGKNDSDPKKRPQVMVLGAGSCKDVPLRELVEKGYSVILVDLDEESMKVAIQELPENLRKFVSYEVRDVSGGYITNLSIQFKKIIDKSKTIEAALIEILQILSTKSAPVPILEGTAKVDLLISTMIVSQIAEFLITQIGVDIHKKFGPIPSSIEISFLRSAIVFNWTSRVQDSHSEGLRDFVVRSRGIVFYSSDITIIPLIKILDLNVTLEKPSTPPSPLLSHQGRILHDLGNFYAEDKAIEVTKLREWEWLHHPPEKAKTEQLSIGQYVQRVKQGYKRTIHAIILKIKP